MKNINKLIALVLIFTMLILFASCKKECESHVDENFDGICDVCNKELKNMDDENEDNNDNYDPINSPAEFSVKVTTEWGLPISGVVLYVHKSDAEFDVAASPVVTGEDGVADFKLDSEGQYSVQLEGVSEKYIVPTGDAAHGRYSVTESELVIKLSYNPDYHPSVYAVGDKIADFTITDVDGEPYQLSEILKTKDMVMLNFWFINCPPCRAEFPYINSAYTNYKNDVEILAINNTDTASSVKAFPNKYDISIDFPLVASRQGLNPGSFGSQYCPTTVIVDRYGVICLIEIGGIPNDQVWNNAFEYFTKDDYTQTLFTSITDIPKVN